MMPSRADRWCSSEPSDLKVRIAPGWDAHTEPAGSWVARLICPWTILTVLSAICRVVAVAP